MKRPKIKYLVIFILPFLISELISIILEDHLRSYLKFGPWLSFLIAILLIIGLFLFEHFQKNKGDEFDHNGGIVYRNPNFVDREVYINELMDAVKLKQLIVIHGQKGIGKSELIKRIVSDLNQNPEYIEAAFYIQITEKTSSEDFFRELFFKVFNTTSKDTFKTKLKLRKELEEHVLLIAIDFQTKLQENQKQIISFVQELRFIKSKFIIATDDMLGLAYDKRIDLGPLNETDRKKISENHIKKLFDHPNNRIFYSEVKTDLDYLCKEEKNTLALLHAVECIAYGLTPEDALKQTKNFKFHVILDELMGNMIMQDIIAVFLLLDFSPTFDQLVLITGKNISKENISKLSNSILFSIETDVTESNVYKIDKEFREFLIENQLLQKVGKDYIYDNWVNWAIDSSKRYANRDNWKKHIYIYHYLNTYRNVLAYCDEKQRSEEIIRLWKNLDYFLSIQATTEIYEEFGEIALAAAKSIDDKHNKSVIEAEVLGYILVYKKPFSSDVYDEAMTYLKNAEKYFKNMDLKTNLANCWRYQARLLVKKAGTLENEEKGALLQEAETLLHNSFDKFDGEQDVEHICLVYNCLSDIKRHSGDYEKAIHYQQLRVRICKENGFIDMEAKSYYQLGRIYQDLHKLQEAKEFYDLAISFSNEYFLAEVSAVSHYRLAEILLSENDISSAKVKINKAIQISEQASCLEPRYETLRAKIDAEEANDMENNQNHKGYHEELPESVDPKSLPLRPLAPCWSNGSVETVDYDTKDAICVCEYKRCLVNSRNIIISTEEHKK